VDDGFRESFDAFARRNHARLVGSLRLYCGDLDIAQEAAADTMVKLLVDWDRVAAKESPEAWMFRVAFNLVKSSYRRRSAENRAFGRLNVEPSAEESADVATSMVVRQALAALPRRQAQAIVCRYFFTSMVVRQALAALPRRQAQAIVCRYFLDLDVIESAQVMGVTPGSLKVYTSRGVSRLRRMLGAELTEESFRG